MSGASALIQDRSKESENRRASGGTGETRQVAARAGLDRDHALLSLAEHSPQMRRLLKRVAPAEVPLSEELFTAAALEEHLVARGYPPFNLVAVGDIMLGGRARRAIAEHGPAYPFEATMPLLRRAAAVLGNLEGPFAKVARRQERTYAYRMNPALAGALAKARVAVLTLANNHLMDCGRAGVLETLNALERAAIAPLGAGLNERAAHTPVILEAEGLRLGLLGYYWNRRCAASAELPGGAMDPPEALEADICALRRQVDRVVVTFHWGVPYEREPSAEDRAKARFAVERGADAVVGHHPHVVQPFEIYRGRPIFYSVGNFAFGSGNSRAEGLLLGFRFEPHKTSVNIYPLYVKNRDPRVNYRPMVLRGASAQRALGEFARISGASGSALRVEGDAGRIELARPDGERSGDPDA